LDNITKEYQQEVTQNYHDKNWQENPEQIHKMIKEINQFDLLRNQQFAEVFPEVNQFYHRYLT